MKIHPLPIPRLATIAAVAAAALLLPGFATPAHAQTLIDDKVRVDEIDRTLPEPTAWTGLGKQSSSERVF